MEGLSLPPKHLGYINIRVAFLLPCVLLGLIPLTGYILSERTVAELRKQQQVAAKAQLHTVSNLLKRDLGMLGDLQVYEKSITPLFLHPTTQEVDIDGRLKEWTAVPAIRAGFEVVQALESYDESSLTFDLRLQASPDAVYLYFRVTDDNVIYREISNISIHRNDYIRLELLDHQGQLQKYTLATEQPGTLYARVVSAGGRSLRPEAKIEAVWRATDLGYEVEIKVDRSLIHGQLAFSVADVDDTSTRAIKYLLGNGTGGNAELVHLVEPSKALNDLFIDLHLHGFEFTDVFGHQLAYSSDIPIANAGHTLTSPIFAQGIEYGELTVTLDDSEIIQFQRETREQTVLLGVAALGLGLLLSWWLSRGVLRRINHLGQALESVVDDQGRVLGALETPVGGDALNDLSRRFVSITHRLQQYNEYLEQLSRRLAHELRTPVSVVRSSLEHLEANIDSENEKFVQRANNGVSRLTNILNSMSEATRIEQSLNKDEVIVFSLNDVIQGCVEGYQQAFDGQQFELIVEASGIKITGIPELLAQMLDKIVDNAVQFSTDEQPITLRLSQEKDQVFLRISNSGEALPENMSEQLFDPMISVRPQTNESHLGLGLYVARIITEFHGGAIELRNREDRKGAVVTVRLPVMRLTSKLA